MNNKLCIPAAIVITVFPFYANAQDEKNVKKSVLLATKNDQIMATITVGDYRTTRRITDLNNDGWDDLWCYLYEKEIKHRNKKIDTDGDGLTDYEEMLLWRNPIVKGSMPKKLTPIELAQLQKKTEIKKIQSVTQWNTRVLEATQKGMKLITKLNQETKSPRMIKKAAVMQRLVAKARQTNFRAEEKNRLLREKATKHGLNIVNKQLDGTVLRFVGEDEKGSPIFTTANNRVAAASISADELWSAVMTPWASGSTGLNLTGDGQTLAIWENDGGVRTTHAAFGARVIQRDGAAQDTSGHATEVCGTMVSAGTGNVHGTGIAYGANVEAFDISNLDAERLNAAAGTYGQVLTVGNNSWSVTNGWSLFIAAFQGGQPVYRWLWFGDPNQAVTVDPKFGRYTEDLALQDIDCVDIDTFSHTDAPHTLLVYSSGNDRGQGPGNALLRVPPNNLATPRYFIYVGGVYQPRNPAFFPKDWEDGDDGGYDSLSAPGTAKNVLTVGACLDVTHIDGNIAVPGFGDGSVVLPADYSGAGPADDGRLKPDLVAVGSPSSAARNALGITPTTGLVTPTQSSNSSYQTSHSQGTSYSAPAVTGGIGLMLQRRAQLYPNLPANDLWLNSTLKALAINGCDDVGAPGPDYRLGHGLFNAASSVLNIDEDYELGRGSQIKEFELDPGESTSWLVSVDGTKPLSITAAWSDPAGPGQPYSGTPDISTPALVNNIDIKIENIETGQVILPWVLNPDLINQTSAARSAAATQGVDNINNVERINMQTPVAGIYQITVTHSGGLVGNPVPSTQNISVVSSNAKPLIGQILSVEVSPTQDQFILTYTSDPGAFYDIQTSTDLINWSVQGTTTADTNINTLMVTSIGGDSKRFWRLQRSK